MNRSRLVLNKTIQIICNLFIVCLFTLSTSSIYANDWKENLRGYNSAMKQTEKPKIIYFYADWCHACESVKSEIFGNTKVQEVLENFAAVKIDVDQGENSSIVRKYMTIVYGNSGSYAIPEIFLVEAGGDRIVRIPPVNRTTPNNFNEYLNKFLSNKIPFVKKRQKNEVTRERPKKGPVNIQPYYGYMQAQFSWQPRNFALQSGLGEPGSNAPKEVYGIDTGFTFFKRYGFGVELYLGLAYYDQKIGSYLDGGLSFNILDLKGFQVWLTNGIGTGPFSVSSTHIFMNYYIKTTFMIGRQISLFSKMRFYFDYNTVFDMQNPYWSFGTGYAF
ncbi:MAG: thioredoxin family protein [Leptospirales bacterium]